MTRIAMSAAAKQKPAKGQDALSNDAVFDRELADLPEELRWREWMGRIEAVLFASATPVGCEDLARVVGQGMSVEMLIEDRQQPTAITRSTSPRTFWIATSVRPVRTRNGQAISATSGPARGGCISRSSWTSISAA